MLSLLLSKIQKFCWYNWLFPPRKYDDFVYSSMIQPEPDINKFIDELNLKYKHYSFGNFNNLYTYLELNDKKELYKNNYMLSFIDNEYVFI